MEILLSSHQRKGGETSMVICPLKTKTFRKMTLFIVMTMMLMVTMKTTCITEDNSSRGDTTDNLSNLERPADEN